MDYLFRALVLFIALW